MLMLATKGPEVDWGATLTCWGSFALVGILGALLVWSYFHGEAEKRRRLAEAGLALAAARQARWDDLCRRFGPEIAAAILRQNVWMGETLEMLIHTFGSPDDTDTKVTKTKTRHVLKWGRLAVNRYAIHVTVEDDVVVGWER